MKLCHECYEKAFDPGNSFTAFLEKSLKTGVVFTANSGSGNRMKKKGSSYAVTEKTI
jgi:hypothetical protein